MDNAETKLYQRAYNAGMAAGIDRKNKSYQAKLKIWIVCNYDNGDFEVCHGEDVAMEFFNLMIEKGTAAEDIGIFQGMKRTVGKVVKYEYKIKD